MFSKLLERIELHRSTGRVIDGIWIGGWNTDPAMQRVESALALIKLHDPRRYARLRRDLPRIWVRLVIGGRACFNPTLRACELDPRYVTDSQTTLAHLATTIAHEGTHARIEQCGIEGSRPELRHRVEAACFRQEIALADRLPDGARAKERAEAWLTAPPEFWSDRSIEVRDLDSTVEALGHVGVPPWLLPILRRVGMAARAIRRLMRAA